MKIAEATKVWQEAGQRWLDGEPITEITLGDRTFKFSENQVKFLNAKERYNCFSGGFGCGKTLPLLIKMVLFCLFFPGNRVLLGRKTLQDIDRSLLPDFRDLVPNGWYNHRIKEGVIEFFNKSQIILFGLDALQEGSIADIKKAQQKVKSLNLGAYFIDQLEEIEYEVFNSLNSRLRRMDAPIRQGNMTTNPANFWAYDFFKVNSKKREDISLTEGSMLENKDNLPEDYLKDQMEHDENYVQRFVYGIWSKDVLTQNVVVAKEYIQRFEGFKRPPLATEEGCEIYEQPKLNEEYQMGIDPSEGAFDPSSISVVSKKTGRKVAKYKAFIPIVALGEKVKFLYFKYNKPRIIPEANASGAALIEQIKDLNIYHRRVFEYREKREVKKVGWKTTFASKQALISHFINLCRKDFPKILDEATIEEFKSFVWQNSAKQKGAGAERGFHDDDVISTMLAYWELKPVVVDEFAAIKKEQLLAKRSRARKAHDHI